MSTATNYVRVEDAGGVRAVVLDRAAKANALCAAMLDDIRNAIERAPRDGMDLLVLRSAAPALFCAGGDIEEFALGEQALERQGAALRELMAAMARCPLPLLAVARGKAAGAGVILLAMTDLVIAGQDLSLACPEMAFSMYPVIVQAALETKISAARARQLCLSGQALDTAAARDLGLVTDVLGLDGFEAQAERRLAYYAGRRAALAIARKARLAMEPPDATVARVRALEPLMHENFRIPGVRETIQDYLASLRTRRAG